MSKPTREEVEAWFKEFDTDGSGKIDKNELKTVVKAFYSECCKKPVEDSKIDADVAAIMKEVDTSGDHMIDMAEFVKFFSC